MEEFLAYLQSACLASDRSTSIPVYTSDGCSPTDAIYVVTKDDKPLAAVQLSRDAENRALSVAIQLEVGVLKVDESVPDWISEWLASEDPDSERYYCEEARSDEVLGVLLEFDEGRLNDWNDYWDDIENQQRGIGYDSNYH